MFTYVVVNHHESTSTTSRNVPHQRCRDYEFPKTIAKLKLLSSSR